MPSPSLRRRSARAHTAVLEAASDLLDEVGYARLTVDAIAARACVSKATIYRWWPNKASIVMEGFLAAVSPDLAFPDTGSVAADLRSQIQALADVFANRHEGHMLRSLLAEAQHDPELAAAIRREWVDPRREVARAVLARGIARGELRADLDLEVALDALYGPLYFRMLVGHRPLDPPEVASIVDTVLRGMRSS